MRHLPADIVETLYLAQQKAIEARIRRALPANGNVVCVREGRMLRIAVIVGDNTRTETIELTTASDHGEHVGGRRYPPLSVVTVDQCTVHIAREQTRTHPMSGSRHWALLGAMPEPEMA